ncbi:MAG: DNA double-strand break repair nuclease NurA [Armatimonadetes bacterium]|nr:DNA double-strand break repair nuclease NurA [Armatimonadota bacterium]
MLDFAQIVRQIDTFTSEQARELPKRAFALDEAVRRLNRASEEWELLQERIEESKSSWYLAELCEAPNRRVSAESPVLPCTVIATDGSQIVGDRHDAALCYVLNVGKAIIRYGTGERATLSSRPQLYLPDEEMLDSKGEQDGISPRRLAIKRFVAEMETLAEEVEALPTLQPPAIALVDGTLLFWLLEGETEEYRVKTLTAYEQTLEVGRRRRVPIVGYISSPQSKDVLNALRLVECPYPLADCDRHCPNRQKPKPRGETPPCAGNETLNDADLFEQTLEVGERSALFKSSRMRFIREERPSKNIYFCYLHVGVEVVRLEIPDWVAEETALLERAHSLCYDQAQKGAGYPVALTEAHEQAVVRASERDTFFRLVERKMIGDSIPLLSTRKALSKQRRRV